jgi:hypothetical protein
MFLCKWRNEHIHSSLKIFCIYFVLCRILSLEGLEPGRAGVEDFDGFRASTSSGAQIVVQYI